MEKRRGHGREWFARGRALSGRWLSLWGRQRHQQSNLLDRAFVTRSLELSRSKDRGSQNGYGELPQG